MANAKYDRDHKAHPGYVADPAKVAALKAKTDAINASKCRGPKPAVLPSPPSSGPSEKIDKK